MRELFWLGVTWVAWPFYRYLGIGSTIVGVASGKYARLMMQRVTSDKR